MLTKLGRLSSVGRLAPRLGMVGTVVPNRNAALPPMTSKEVIRAQKLIMKHMDCTPVPQGDWKTDYDRRQTFYNMQLAASAIVLCLCIYYANRYEWFYMNFPWQITLPAHFIPDECKKKK